MWERGVDVREKEKIWKRKRRGREREYVGERNRKRERTLESKREIGLERNGGHEIEDLKEKR